MASYLVCYLESSIHTLGVTEQRGSSLTQLYHGPLAGSVGPDCANQMHGSNFKELFQKLAVSPTCHWTNQCLIFECFACSLKSFDCYLGKKTCICTCTYELFYLVQYKHLNCPAKRIRYAVLNVVVCEADPACTKASLQDKTQYNYTKHS